MNHVDALSRNIGPTETDIGMTKDDGFMPNVFHIETENWLLTLQLGDQELQRIKKILTSKDSVEEVRSIKEDYVIKNNQLYRFVDKEKKELRWVVPKGARWQICRLNHDDIGHFAFEKSYERIRKTYWFPKMKRFIKKYIKACLNCFFHKDDSNAKQGLLHPIEKVPSPFHTLHIDHLGPFVKTKNNNTHILVVVDSFTKYCFIKPVKDTKTKNVIKVLNDIFYMFRIPNRIISDRGSSFTSNDFKQFCSDKNIKLVLNAVASPRSNGQVERYNRTVLNSLSAQTHGLDERLWDSYTGVVQWGINHTYHKSIEKTPAEVLFGTKMNCEINSPQLDEILEVTRSNLDVEDIREQASASIEKNQTVQKANYDKGRKPATVYNEGDLVKITKISYDNDGKSKKLVEKFIGPYVVTKVLGNDRYRISDIDGFKSKTKRKYKATVAADRMRPWIHIASLNVHED